MRPSPPGVPAARVSIEPWMIPLSLAKGIVMAAVILGLAETSFLQSLAIAVSSATVTGSFLVIASWVQARHTGRKIDEVKDQAEAIAERVEAPLTPGHGNVEAG